jgi:hypothetical protein
LQEVGGVEARRVHFDEHFVGTWFWCRALFEDEFLRADHDGAHGTII